MIQHDHSLARWIWFALLGSLIVHLFIWLGLQKIGFGALAIPYQKTKMEHPFEVKRVELKQSSNEGKNENPLSFVSHALDLNPQPQTTPEASGNVKNLQVVTPQLSIPPPPNPASLTESGVASSSPYSVSNAVNVQAEIAALPVGESSSVSTMTNSVPSPEGTGASAAEGGETKETGTPTAGSSQMPSFAEISPNFKGPSGDFNPRLPEPVMLRLPSDVIFDFNSVDLKPDALPLLQQAADYIKKYPVAKIQVDGHTDTIGSDDYNQTLSENRARSVEKWLKQHLEGGNFTFDIHGYGKTRPIVNPNGTPDQQQRNRRVEIIIQALDSPSN